MMFCGSSARLMVRIILTAPLPVSVTKNPSCASPRRARRCRCLQAPAHA
jgi:hypothetical protein